MMCQDFFEIHVQWNLSCVATFFALGKWLSNRGGLSSGVEISTFLLRFT